eukprot:c23395_g1_i1 orf=279-1367(-)
MSHDPQTANSRNVKMGLESSSFRSGKRTRSAEDELFLDNYHMQKRYLSEVMASSFDGLKVGDSLPEDIQTSPQTFDLIESTAHTELGCISRSTSSFPSNCEEMSTLDSLMSDESDESIGYRVWRNNETAKRNLTCHSDPVSPSAQRILTNNGSHPDGMCSMLPMATCPVNCSRQRATETGSRFPPSPSDPCYPGDLRRTALLRSVQMRAQSPLTTRYAASAGDSLDLGMRNIEESDELSSPGSLSVSFGEISPEPADQNDHILGSPAHGVFPSQIGRGSGRVRSLLLDECIHAVPLSDCVGLPSTLDTNLSKPERSSMNSLKFGKDGENSICCGSMDINGKFKAPFHDKVLDGPEKMLDVSD